MTEVIIPQHVNGENVVKIDFLKFLINFQVEILIIISQSLCWSIRDDFDVISIMPRFLSEQIISISHIRDLATNHQHHWIFNSLPDNF